MISRPSVICLTYIATSLIVKQILNMDEKMNITDDQKSHTEPGKNEYVEELKAFDETKAGVKGLVDAGVVSVPRIFIRPTEELAEELNAAKSHHFQVPVIDFTGIKIAERRQEIVNEIKVAAGKYGFFQILNHSIPVHVINEMIDGVSRFNELDVEEKKEFYTREVTKAVRFNSNYDLYKSKTANWRDTISISVSDELNPSELPEVCRVAVMEYTKHVTELGDTLFELLSEALGLESNYLQTLECANSFRLACHYYPACPEPERTIGCTKHTDAGFLTILLQNQINGLQIHYEDQWVDIHPIPGALAVNVGDLLQLISNDKVRSIEHRVVANRVGPRISVACFFSGPIPAPKRYGPIKELISEENPPLYKEVLLSEYVANFLSRGLQEKLTLDYYRL